MLCNLQMFLQLTLIILQGVTIHVFGIVRFVDSRAKISILRHPHSKGKWLKFQN